MKVFGIKSGLAVIDESENATRKVSLRAFTFDAESHVNIAIVDLSPEETKTLYDRLGEILEMKP